jgi:two-component system phosphate regulon response regulator PhoB
MCSKSRVVVLVQPHEDNRDMYAEFLRHCGFVVFAFADADEALTIAPLADVIVTDFRSSIDGAQLVARLKADARTRATPIVVLSASAQPHDRARLEAAGCDCFLAMPCLPGELLQHVQRLMDTTRAQ